MGIHRRAYGHSPLAQISSMRRCDLIGDRSGIADDTLESVVRSRTPLVLIFPLKSLVYVLGYVIGCIFEHHDISSHTIHVRSFSKRFEGQTKTSSFRAYLLRICLGDHHLDCFCLERSTAAVGFALDAVCMHRQVYRTAYIVPVSTRTTVSKRLCTFSRLDLG
jgi:hypothetical protein